MVATDLLNPAHPLHKSFLSWLKGKEATKRQARKFLQKYPQYRGIQETDSPPTHKEG